MRLHWRRRDLRAADNAGLTAAVRRALDYTGPIVDHGERREQAIATFERARGDD